MGLVIPEVINGAGRHTAYLDPAKATVGLKLNFITQPVFLWAITTVKISIALFLLRIAPNKTYRKILWGVIIFLLVYTFASMMTIFLQCTNIAILWDSTVKATCWPATTSQALSYVNSSKSIRLQLQCSYSQTLSPQCPDGFDICHPPCSYAVECPNKHES
jgi:hypothetical protein